MVLPKHNFGSVNEFGKVAGQESGGIFLSICSAAPVFALSNGQCLTKNRMDFPFQSMIWVDTIVEQFGVFYKGKNRAALITSGVAGLGVGGAYTLGRKQVKDAANQTAECATCNATVFVAPQTLD